MTTLTYKILTKNDLPNGVLSAFTRTQTVTRVWRKSNFTSDAEPRWKIEETCFTDDWTHAQKHTAIPAYLRECITGCGFVAAAAAAGKIIGFASLDGTLMISPAAAYADLTLLHVSREYRNMGIGKKLFAMCAEKARVMGATKLYISAHSSVESQGFYRGIGCVDATDPSKLHADLEPFDCQLEFAIL